MTRIIIPLAILVPLLFSCVSNKKFQELEYLQGEGMIRERQLQAQLDYAREHTDQLEERIAELNNVIGVLRNDKSKLEADTSRQGSRLRDMSRRAQATQEELATELESKSTELDDRIAQLTEIREALDTRDRRLQDAYAELRDTIFASFNPDDASIEIRDGKIFITLSDELVFGNRSTRVSSDGEQSLGILAAVFNRYPDLEVFAIGHTSNTRPSSGYADNWDLSARRAAAAVSVLTKKFDLSPNQITAAGKGESQPLVTNDSKENQQKNRRLELVMTPRLDMLYNILREETGRP